MVVFEQLSTPQEFYDSHTYNPPNSRIVRRCESTDDSVIFPFSAIPLSVSLLRAAASSLGSLSRQINSTLGWLIDTPRICEI